MSYIGWVVKRHTFEIWLLNLALFLSMGCIVGFVFFPPMGHAIFMFSVFVIVLFGALGGWLYTIISESYEKYKETEERRKINEKEKQKKKG